MFIDENTQFSRILARRAKPHMARVRETSSGEGWKGHHTDDTDTIWGLWRPPVEDKTAKEYPVVLFTDRFPEGLHYGPGEKITIVRASA